MKQLFLGGARSGKSAYAEKTLQQWADATPGQLIYVATAQAWDDEMANRISLHQQSRSNRWRVVECHAALGDTLQQYQGPEHIILVDCLTLWLSHCLHANCWAEQREAFLESVTNTTAHIGLVSNEVGSGVVPLGKLSREFVDESGRLHQQLAEIFDQVTLVVAGLPLSLK